MILSYSQPRPIESSDDVAGFDSSEPDLDEYLRNYALGNHRGGGARCFVTCSDGSVVGYYALAAGSIIRADTTRRVGQSMPNPVPVILIGRLAVDRKEQGRGLGAHLLRDAIAKSVEAGELIGARAILLHAMNDNPRSFYLHFNFEPSPTDDYHLILLMKDARKIIRG